MVWSPSTVVFFYGILDQQTKPTHLNLLVHCKITMANTEDAEVLLLGMK